MTFHKAPQRWLTSAAAFTLTGVLASACGGEAGDDSTSLQRDPIVPGSTVTPPATPVPVTPGNPTTPTPPANPPANPPGTPPVTPPPVAQPPVTPPSPPVTPPTTTTPPVTPPANPPVTPPVNPTTTPPAEPPAPPPAPPATESGFGTPQYTGSGSSSERYGGGDVQRNGVNYKFITNGWGPGYENQSISWNGTSFTVASFNGSPGDNYQPAGYPTMYCGQYSEVGKPSKECGLPASIDSLSSLKTGWRWKANGNTSDYNAAWDIWVYNGSQFAGFMMVWLRDPPGQQPAGMLTEEGVTVAGLPGTWNVWVGKVNNAPIINWVKPEGQDLEEFEFDVMDLVRDAPNRGFTVPGTDIGAVAIGFEIWEGPVTNLVTEDFYVDVQKK